MSVLAADQIPSTVPQYKKVTLTANQIKALFATPITIVSTPGAGFAAIPVFATLTYHGDGATPYDVSGGGDIKLVIGTTDLFSSNMRLDEGMLTETTDVTGAFDLSGIYSGSYDDTANIEDKDIKILNAGPGEYTLGDGTADIVIHYLVIPTA